MQLHFTLACKWLGDISAGFVCGSARKDILSPFSIQIDKGTRTFPTTPFLY